MWDFYFCRMLGDNREASVSKQLHVLQLELMTVSQLVMLL